MSDVSVVVPVFGNAACLEELHRRLVATLDGTLRELILVDDASPDDASAVIGRLAGNDPRVKGIPNPVNRGQHISALTGMDAAEGEWVVVMDGDLQDPPEAIPDLLAAAEEEDPSPDVVFAGRRGRYESGARLLTGRLFKRALSRMTGVPPDAGMFFAARAEAVQRVLGLQGPPPFVVAMVGAAGLDSVSVPVVRAREGGESGYTWAGRIRSAARGLRWGWRGRTARRERGVDTGGHNETQHRYYAKAKRGMDARPSRYLERHVDELIAFAGLEPGARLLEVGAGQGRYTLPLHDRGFRVEVLELVPAMAEEIERVRGDRDIPVHLGDILDPPAAMGGGFDGVIGFFALHHMHDPAACIGSMAGLLAPGGRLAFVEPNPFNPLYYVQMAITPEMTWEGDKGMLGMRRGPLTGACKDAGLGDVDWKRFGFFPPQIADRQGSAAVERAIERIPPLRPFLPFQLVGGVKR